MVDLPNTVRAGGRAVKTLLILRHAKSSWKQPELPDHDRPLNKRGKKDAPRMGRLIHQLQLVPDLILSSTAVRARSTALAVAEACKNSAELRLLRDLYLAEPDDYAQVLATLDERYRSVMIVGHNPGLEDLVEALTGLHEILPTAALARVALPIDGWSEMSLDGSARLEQLWRPKELPSR
jgi:phosphohistidine phosphatase